MIRSLKTARVVVHVGSNEVIVDPSMRRCSAARGVTHQQLRLSYCSLFYSLRSYPTE